MGSASLRVAPKNLRPGFLDQSYPDHVGLHAAAKYWQSIEINHARQVIVDRDDLPHPGNAQIDAVSACCNHILNGEWAVEQSLDQLWPASERR